MATTTGTQTPTIKLEKPSQEDLYNIAVFNANSDKIDAAIANLQTSLTTLNNTVTSLQTTLSTLSTKVTTLENNAITFVKTGEF